MTTPRLARRGPSRERCTHATLEHSHGRVPFALASWTTCVAFWLTFTPWAPDWTPSQPIVETVPRLLSNAVGNLFLLAPLAIVVALASRGSTWRRVRRAAAAAALVSLVIETAQLFIAGRVTSLADLTLNAAGGGLFAWAALRLRARGVPAASILVATLLVVFAALSGHRALATLSAASDFQIGEWRHDFGLVAGRETDGDREYEGEVRDTRICAGRRESRVCAAAGADAELRGRLAATAEHTQRIDLFAEVVPANVSQSGPTRILTFSSGLEERNAMLGQDSSALVFRVRTYATGPNGEAPEFRLRGAFRPHTPVRLHAAFDRGRIRLEAVGSGARATFDARVHHMSVGRSIHYLHAIDGPTYARATVATTVVFFFGLGLCAGWLRPGGRLPAATAVGLAAAVVLAGDRLFGHAAAPSELVAAAALALLGALVGSRDRVALEPSASADDR